MMTNNTKAIISAGFAILSWATVATAFKIALREMTHYELLLVAGATTVMIFAVLMTIQRKWKLMMTMSFRRWMSYALLGLLNPVAYYLVLFKSYSLLPAQIAQPINYMWPIFLTVMLAIFAHRPIPGLKYIGLAISLLGVTCISLGSSSLGNMQLSVSGLLLVALSAVLWASYWMVRDRDKSDTTIALFLCFLFGTVYLFAAIPFTGPHHLLQPGILSGIYVGCFEMGLPFIAFGYALRKTTNTALINQMCYLSPFLSLFIIALVLGEHIVITTIIGLILIVAGIVFNEYGVKLFAKKDRR
jgi:drug/metabolite transporter (DMT)-like permease